MRRKEELLNESDRSSGGICYEQIFGVLMTSCGMRCISVITFERIIIAECYHGDIVNIRILTEISGFCVYLQRTRRYESFEEEMMI